jgi:hypothetical protein
MTHSETRCVIDYIAESNLQVPSQFYVILREYCTKQKHNTNDAYSHILFSVTSEHMHTRDTAPQLADIVTSVNTGPKMRYKSFSSLQLHFYISKTRSPLQKAPSANSATCVVRISMWYFLIQRKKPWIEMPAHAYVYTSCNMMHAV